MAETFHLIVASVGETKFDGAAVSATLPGSAGEFTVLAHHEPIVTTLKPGKIIVRPPALEVRVGEPGQQLEFSIQGGIIEMSGNRAVVLL
ncbi:MAG TPA: F0F1 ATP synthase subunit epsilon [Candidatus Paceibacterota bacterium]